MKVQQYIERCVGEKVFPGASWSVGGIDGIFEKGSAGVLGKGLGPVSDDTLYDLASLTKIFVALAFMKQFEEGLVRLDDRVDYFLPSYASSPFGEVPLFSLLTHTAPFPGGTQLYQHAKSREEILNAIRLSGTRKDSPDKVVYTCEAFILLGEIVSAVDTASLDEVIRRRVTSPLEMKDTCYKPGTESFPRIAPTEDCVWRGKMVRGQVHDENAVLMGEVSGNAGLFSSAADMSRLASAMLMSLETGAFLNRASA
jgi:CubicO group peptidase (beta-lactamase class C family)